MNDETAGSRRPDLHALYDNIHTRGKAMGLSAADITKLSGLPAKWLDDLANGTAPLSRAALIHLSRVLHTTPEHLLTASPTAFETVQTSARFETAQPTERQLVEMGESECYARLALQEVGRVVPGERAEPLALPVNYILDGKDVVFRTAPDSPLCAVRGPVAFEVDEEVRLARLGWSVLINGRVERIEDAWVIARLAAAGNTCARPSGRPARVAVARMWPGPLRGVARRPVACRHGREHADADRGTPRTGAGSPRTRPAACSRSALRNGWIDPA
ncbi:pyridoxamine 5'-phosphate oxidase family protein [Embleya sp. NPDC020630]|uniref:pyridoxamine 5'-phosphate oxidase family protein n=1 Tax=Embleya sp. NPDC020630 TaxID=3363979 RepID=UPI00379DE4D2